MDFDYSEPWAVQISMIKHLQKVFDDFPDVIRKPASNRASDHLFQIRDPEEVELIGKYLPEEQAAHFHHTVAQLLLAGVKKPDEDDWGKLKRVLKYLQGTMHMKLKLSVENMGMVKWWVDASYNAHEDCRGQTGAMMSLGKGAVVSKSTKQKLNLHSLSEGELVGIDDALPWILWARYFIETQGYTMEQNILFQDNKSTILLAKNGRWSSSKRTKHIKLRYFFIKDKVDSGEVDIRYVPTEQMWSDILTKPKQGKGFRVDRSHLMNVPEDYDEEEERKCMNPQLLPADNDDPVLPHGKLGQYCRSVLEDKRVEYKVSESTVRQNKERRQADLERVRIRKRRNLEDVRRPMVDMEKVQVHPTGWVDPADPSNPAKVLAGELMRGVGGILMNCDGKRDNRLGGNSLLECTVYGTIVGRKISIKQRNSIKQHSLDGNTGPKQVELPKVTMEVLRQHNSEDDCWFAISGKVYDLTDFSEEHPAGPESIRELAGQDGTEAFEAIHSEKVLEDFDPVGIMII
ncbi:hypothetical protein HJC23_002571 [Cyclotella cryptica]|uniref:Cytochrome b5 heme-binding domain-containing protein n=1 Tax=Cyclotella cryptica TaxID=29204 RepID=A0ABD3QWX6_9STRA